MHHLCGMVLSNFKYLFYSEASINFVDHPDNTDYVISVLLLTIIVRFCSADVVSTENIQSGTTRRLN